MRLHAGEEVGVIARLRIRPGDFGDGAGARQRHVQIAGEVPRMAVIRPRIAGGTEYNPHPKGRYYFPVSLEDTYLFEFDRGWTPEMKGKILLAFQERFPDKSRFEI